MKFSWNAVVERDTVRDTQTGAIRRVERESFSGNTTLEDGKDLLTHILTLPGKLVELSLKVE